MTSETKVVRGRGLGTRMDWLCTRHRSENLGFGNLPAITCVDMTVHAPEHGRPNVVFSAYENTGESGLKHAFHPKAYKSPEQVGMAKMIVDDWDKLPKSGKRIDIKPIFEK